MIINVYMYRFDLVTTKMLDFDDPAENITFRLTVIVNDTKNTDTIIVDLAVTDLNDNTPVFDNTTFR